VDSVTPQAIRLPDHVGINRIHHFCTAAVPDIAAHLVLSPYDDFRGRMRSRGVAPSRWQILFTGTAVVGGINSTLARVFAALLGGWLMTWDIPISATLAAAVFCASSGAHARWESVEWARFGMREHARFPSPR
jgi:hypothetical protein